MDRLGISAIPAPSRAPRAPNGSYVAIYRRLLSPESRYRQVSATAQLAFLTLKLLLPFANIERRARWAAEIADNSALSEDQAAAALTELAQAGIIEFDGRVLWVVQGLACEPTAMTSKVSAFLLKGLRRHLDNIGANAIADRFRAHYAALFAGDTARDSIGDPSRDGSPDPSGEVLGQESGEARARKSVAAADGSHPRRHWLEHLTALLRARLGDVPPDVVEKRLGAIAQRDGVDRVVEVAQHYFATCPPRWWSIGNLAQRYGAFAADLDGTGAPVPHHDTDAISTGASFASPAQYLRELAAGSVVLAGGFDDE
ncbi:MAG: hypothetical protein O9319_00270 [Gemmatimonas sp.]|uniref:hypothetical protein n=1 Tax=Gemmatimonas sp. TaxID=1962908 RepID=UPI0022C04A2C|nr:hypothetical protein [Gemmatimonas sp.]MCZ8012990.1 hypothetical protein [Gemmatimonas sp.]MCZ8265264.1 hypothetical protein [Gemmatimonas sp.]